MLDKKIKISENLEKLALKLKNRADLFLIGGYVRNSLMGFYETDVDLAGEITPSEMKELLKYSDYKVTEKSKKLGTLLIKIDDEVISTGYSMGQAGLYYSFELTASAHSVAQITIQYVLVACSYGNVTHWVTLGK